MLEHEVDVERRTTVSIGSCNIWFGNNHSQAKIGRT